MFKTLCALSIYGIIQQGRRHFKIDDYKLNSIMLIDLKLLEKNFNIVEAISLIKQM